VVDDDPSIRRALSRVFADRYDVLTAESGSQGVEILTEAVHCVILDVKMKQKERIPPLMKELQAPTGVGLFVAHEGFDYVWKTADLAKAAYDNAHGGNCYIFS
jgi:DNA-binding NtrC family response regulator